MQQINTSLSQARARRALTESGLPADTHLHRAPSTRNEVFLSSQHVIRINRRPNNRLYREAKLVRALPDLPWRPSIVAFGGGVGSDYLIVERKAGSPLSRWWPDMSQASRRDAIRQLVECLKVVHTTPAPYGLPGIENSPHLIDFGLRYPTTPLVASIHHLAELPLIDSGVMAEALALVKANESAFTQNRSSCLIHGDLSLENVLWDGHTISGLLDFEWSRPAPIDLDLDVILRFCAFPFAHVAPDYEDRTFAADYASVPKWLTEFEPELFAHPELKRRLIMYALSFDINELATCPPERSATDLGPLHPYNRLLDLVRGESHLDRVLSQLGID